MTRRQIQRLAPRFVISLVLGAAIGIAVAWVRINRCDRNTSNERSTSAAIECAGMALIVKVTRSPCSTDVWFLRFDSRETAERAVGYMAEMDTRDHTYDGVARTIPGWSLVEFDRYAGELPSSQAFRRPSISVTAAGWPFLCVKDVHLNTSPGPPEFHGVIQLGANRRDLYGLPWLPIWRGLLLNALFYAPIPLLFHAGWGALRRDYRRRLGLCARCGYDVRGSAAAACPECGG
jgi:hypothetical protein